MKFDPNDSNRCANIEHTMDGLRWAVCIILTNEDQAGGIAWLLSRMILAYHLHAGAISVVGKDQSDFVDRVLCRL